MTDKKAWNRVVVSGGGWVNAGSNREWSRRLKIHWIWLVNLEAAKFISPWIHGSHALLFQQKNLKNLVTFAALALGDSDRWCSRGLLNKIYKKKNCFKIFHEPGRGVTASQAVTQLWLPTNACRYPPITFHGLRPRMNNFITTLGIYRNTRPRDN